MCLYEENGFGRVVKNNRFIRIKYSMIAVSFGANIKGNEQWTEESNEVVSGKASQMVAHAYSLGRKLDKT